MKLKYVILVAGILSGSLSWAQINFTDLKEDVVFNTLMNHQFDLNGDGNDDVQFEIDSVFQVQTGIDYAGAGLSELGFIEFTAFDAKFLVLDSGTNVADTSRFKDLSSFLQFGNNWVGVSNKYLGFRFKKTGSTWTYGWMKISKPSRKEIVIHSMAYHTVEGTPVKAGDSTGAINKPITGITITSANDNYVVNSNGGSLRMLAAVAPVYPTDCSFTWSVEEIDGKATISQNGVLTGVADGFVRVVATANDGSGVRGTRSIECSPIAVNVEEILKSNLTLFPNPATDVVHITTFQKIQSISLLDLTGKMLDHQTYNKNKVDYWVGNFEIGNYVLEISFGDKGVERRKISVMH